MRIHRHRIRFFNNHCKNLFRVKRNFLLNSSFRSPVYQPFRVNLTTKNREINDQRSSTPKRRSFDKRNFIESMIFVSLRDSSIT